jgi:hypothetical protein
MNNISYVEVKSRDLVVAIEMDIKHYKIILLFVITCLN